MGFDAIALTRLETTFNPGISFQLLARIASALDVPVRRLIHEPEEEVASHTAPEGDSAVVEAALGLAERPVRQAELALALGWDANRVFVALKTLRTDRRASGAIVTNCQGVWRQRAHSEILAPDQRQAIRQLGPNARPLHRPEARTLLEYVRRSLDPQRPNAAIRGEAGTRAIVRLRKRGLLENGSRGETRLSAKGSFALGLSDEL
jgi:chromosome segregation and condensation protein ScpB